jgi:hypothetical protein
MEVLERRNRVSKSIVVTALLLGMIGGYLGATQQVQAEPTIQMLGRYIPTMATASDGTIKHFCVTDTASGDTVCSEGLSYEYCLDEAGQKSTKCTLPNRRFYVMTSPFARF